MAHIRQSRTDSGLVFKVNALQTFQGVRSLNKLSGGAGDGSGGALELQPCILVSGVGFRAEKSWGPGLGLGGEEAALES